MRFSYFQNQVVEFYLVMPQTDKLLRQAHYDGAFPPENARGDIRALQDGFFRTNVGDAPFNSSLYDEP